MSLDTSNILRILFWELSERAESVRALNTRRRTGITKVKILLLFINSFIAFFTVHVYFSFMRFGLMNWKLTFPAEF